eukprot:1977978-Alexandrium_andersonii.AAC.1
MEQGRAAASAELDLQGGNASDSSRGRRAWALHFSAGYYCFALSEHASFYFNAFRRRAPPSAKGQ